jgi:hypothetical protein
MKTRTIIRPLVPLVCAAAAVVGSGCATGFIESAPTGVSGESATLVGKVGSNLSKGGSYWFEYGDTKDYGQSTPHRSVTFKSNVKQPVMETVTGLTGWHDYHYRLCADDSDPSAPGPHCSGDQTFTTGSPQITLGPDRPRYTLHIAAADGTASAPQSGVDSVSVSVDGRQVEQSTPGCQTQSCGLDHDWTLDATRYAPGGHTVAVTATDAAGRSTTKQLNVDIEPDRTKPAVRASGPLKDAPKGWVDQKTYTVTGDSSDSGYGVTSLKLVIDGQTVGQPVTQQCPDGGCTLSHTFSVNTASYDGGAHAVQLIATDGAGNTNDATWAINVNPSGWIPAAEAADTIAVASDQAVAPNAPTITPDELADGHNPGLERSGDQLQSVRAPTQSTMTTNSADGFVIHGRDDSIQVQPTQTSDSATDASVVGGVAAVAGDAMGNLDTVVRPAFNGVFTFEQIRGPDAPETYSWRVTLDSGQTLVSIDDQTAAVQYADGTPAMVISADVTGQAHDATGAKVPTSLTVSGDTVTLHVSHRNASFAYPIVAGHGWEAAYVEDDTGSDLGWSSDDALLRDPFAGSSQRECAWDSSVTYRVCITQNYNDGTNNGQRTVAVTNYRVRFTGGANGVSIFHTTVVAGEFGPSSFGPATKTWHLGVPRINHTYNLVPPWHGVPVTVSNVPGLFQCAHTSSTLKHGKSTWKLDSPQNCQGKLEAPGPAG